MNTSLPLTMGYCVPRHDYFISNNKIAQIDRFELIWDYRKRPKCLVFSIWVQRHGPRTKMELLKLKCLTFDHGIRKTR